MSFLANHHHCCKLHSFLTNGVRRNSFGRSGINPTNKSRFSSTTSGTTLQQECGQKAVVPPAAVEGILEGTNTRSLGEVVRHGPGDAVLTLNVGGKEFYTLRSTVNANAVLADHVARAEANEEITKNGAVFIDRDPDHFPFILRHLRNRVELTCSSLANCKSAGVLGNHGLTIKWTQANIELPKDERVLRELYTEATFYRVEELKEAICAKSWLANIASFFNMNSNPFDSAAKFLARLRAGVIAVGSLGTVGGTLFVSLQQDLDSLLERLGLQKILKATGVAATK